MTTTELALPASVVPSTWDDNTAALMEFAGLTWMEGPVGNRTRQFAPAGIMAAFIQACQRTGLDPTAKQIYAALMGNKWTVLVGIDGMRLVAQRTGEYDGQDPIEWQQVEDGPWSTTPGKGNPYAARIRVYRKGVSRPLEQVVTFAEFGGSGGNWSKRPAHMLGIRAESHGFRRQFPMELSGLYTAEDIETGTFDEDVLVVEATENWPELIAAAQSKEDLVDVRKRADAVNEYTAEVRALVLARNGEIGRAAAAAPVDMTTQSEQPLAANEEIAVEVPAERDPAEPSPDEYAAAAAEVAADQPDFMSDNAGWPAVEVKP